MEVNNNEECNCPSAKLFPHRMIKCSKKRYRRKAEEKQTQMRREKENKKQDQPSILVATPVPTQQDQAVVVLPAIEDKEKLEVEDPQCSCVSSTLFPHRKSKCSRIPQKTGKCVGVGVGIAAAVAVGTVAGGAISDKISQSKKDASSLDEVKELTKKQIEHIEAQKDQEEKLFKERFESEKLRQKHLESSTKAENIRSEAYNANKEKREEFWKEAIASEKQWQKNNEEISELLKKGLRDI